MSSLFDNQWRQSEHSHPGGWASEVLQEIEGSGKAYLDTIENWFSQFPGTNKAKSNLRAGLKEFNNDAHLGAVNELSFWKFFASRNLVLTPIPRGSGSSPDFVLESEGLNTLIFEVTTLNPSTDERCRDVRISHQKSRNRVLSKAKEKIGQFKYSVDRKLPVILVLFNYNEWSGLGVQFGQSLKNSSIAIEMPMDLSGVLCIERHVGDGKMYFTNDSGVLIENARCNMPVSGESHALIKNLFKEHDGQYFCDYSGA